MYVYTVSYFAVKHAVNFKFYFFNSKKTRRFEPDFKPTILYLRGHRLWPLDVCLYANGLLTYSLKTEMVNYECYDSCLDAAHSDIENS